MVEPTDAADPPLGRRARKALATRLALFDAGLQAFEKRPLSLVSVLDLTEASDVAKGVFYLHFRSKDEFLIELWMFVQGRHLDALREGLGGRSSRRARLESVVRRYHAAIGDARRECRFWLRMASYFEDEIGEPGQMERLRDGYTRELAAIVGGLAVEDVGPRDALVARVVDGACWGLVSQSIQSRTPLVDEATFVRAVVRAVESLPRG